MTKKKKKLELGAENISLGLTETRIQVNEMIKSFVQKNSNKVTLLDLCKEIPFHLPTEKDRFFLKSFLFFFFFSFSFKFC